MSEREQIVSRLSDLQAKQEAATGWGAAVGAREEEIRSLESRLLRIDSMTAPPSTETPRHTATAESLAFAEKALFGKDRGVHYGDDEKDLYAISKASLARAIDTSHASLTAKVTELEADLVRLSAVWIVETQRVEKLETALGLARNRIEYLGVACINPRHHQANCDEFLPRIDAALDNADGGRGS